MCCRGVKINLVGDPLCGECWDDVFKGAATKKAITLLAIRQENSLEAEEIAKVSSYVTQGIRFCRGRCLKYKVIFFKNQDEIYTYLDRNPEISSVAIPGPMSADINIPELHIALAERMINMTFINGLDVGDSTVHKPSMWVSPKIVDVIGIRRPGE